MAVLEQLSIKMAKISEQRHLRAIRDGIGNLSFSKKTCSTNATALPYDNVHNGTLRSYGNRLQPCKIV